MSNNQPDWEDIVEQSREVERMRLLREQNELLEDIASGESKKPGYAARRRSRSADADVVQGVTVIVGIVLLVIAALVFK